MKSPPFGPATAALEVDTGYIGSLEFGAIPDSDQPPQPLLDFSTKGSDGPMLPPKRDARSATLPPSGRAGVLLSGGRQKVRRRIRAG